MKITGFKLKVVNQRRNFSTNARNEIEFTAEQKLLLEKVNRKIQQLTLLKLPLKQKDLITHNFVLLTSAAPIFQQNNFIPDYNLIQAIKKLAGKIYNSESIDNGELNKGLTEYQTLFSSLIDNLGEIEKSFNLNNSDQGHNLDKITKSEIESLKFTIVSIFNTIEINLKNLRAFNRVISTTLENEWRRCIDGSVPGFAPDYTINNKIPINFNEALVVYCDASYSDTDILRMKKDDILEFRAEVIASIKASNRKLWEELNNKTAENTDELIFNRVTRNKKFQEYIDFHKDWVNSFDERLNFIDRQIEKLKMISTEYENIQFELLEKHIKTISKSEKDTGIGVFDDMCDTWYIR